jgi:hypothetical protein
MKHLAIVIDWYGPYSRQQAKEVSKDFVDGLYLGIGKRRHQRSDAAPLYIGLSGTLAARIANHQTLDKITREAKLWLGEISSSNVPGRRLKKTPATLDMTEWVHAYFLGFPLNIKKKKKPPTRPVTVLNRWWRCDYETPWVKRPNPLWPDLIDYMGPDLPARLVWFGKGQKRRKPPYI